MCHKKECHYIAPDQWKRFSNAENGAKNTHQSNIKTDVLVLGKMYIAKQVIDGDPTTVFRHEPFPT